MHFLDFSIIPNLSLPILLLLLAREGFRYCLFIYYSKYATECKTKSHYFINATKYKHLVYEQHKTLLLSFLRHKCIHINLSFEPFTWVTTSTDIFNIIYSISILNNKFFSKRINTIYSELNSVYRPWPAF